MSATKDLLDKIIGKLNASVKTEAQTLTEAQKAQVRANIGIEVVPDYVIAESDAVIDRVAAAQTGRTFTFAAITDLHYGNAGYTDGVKHACQALKYIDERIKLDAVAVLGDYTDGYPADGYANAIADFRTINSVLNALRFGPNLRIQGNHDFYADHAPEIHRHIQAYSEDVVWGDKIGGYFHRDFDGYKLRVICINTTETDNANIACTAAQYKWFAGMLDMSAKDDADEWQILVLSHHPVDWYCTDGLYTFARILNAYKEGTSFSNANVSCDYSGGKNAAVLIGNIHGHIHNLLVDNVHIGNVSGGVKSKVYRMATPEACINRANQYDGAWKEATTYNKTINTADDTSFVIYCIDLDAHTIRAICYGAGHDRELIYHDAKSGYTNQIPISKDASGAIFDGDGIKVDTRLNSSGAEAAQTGTAVTGYIPIKLHDVVRLRNINYLPGVNSVGNYIAIYTPERTSIASVKDTNMTSSMDYLFGDRVVDDSGKLIQFRIADGSKDYGYIRVSAAGLNEESIITINEEIV